MIWVLAGFAIIVAVWVLAGRLKNKRLYSNEEEFGSFVAGLKLRSQALSDEDRGDMVNEARRLAFAGYDRLFAEALVTGRSESFAHQVGVLDAVYCVLANDEVMRKDRNVAKILQRETIPFNVLGQHDGRMAIVEYLIWKIFPDDADLTKVMPAIDSFVKKVIEDSNSESDPKASISFFLRSGRFDWQRLAENSQEMRI